MCSSGNRFRNGDLQIRGLFWHVVEDKTCEGEREAGLGREKLNSDAVLAHTSAHLTMFGEHVKEQHKVKQLYVVQFCYINKIESPIM